MRAGITILPEYRWAEAKPRWQAAEAYGFAHAWTFDHLGWGPLVGGPWLGSVPTLSAAAVATSRIGLGFMVASPNFRHPVSFAQDVMALDDLSDGRLTVGVGAGGVDGYDVDVFGGTTKAASPSRRYKEFVELLDALLTTDGVDYSGEYYTAVDARNAPGCVQRPRTPFVLAANGPKALALTARHGQGWITVGTVHDSLDGWWKSLAELSARFDEALAAADRDPADGPPLPPDRRRAGLQLVGRRGLPRLPGPCRGTGFHRRPGAVAAARGSVRGRRGGPGRRGHGCPADPVLTAGARAGPPERWSSCSSLS